MLMSSVWEMLSLICLWGFNNLDLNFHSLEENLLKEMFTFTILDRGSQKETPGGEDMLKPLTQMGFLGRLSQRLTLALAVKVQWQQCKSQLGASRTRGSVNKVCSLGTCISLASCILLEFRKASSMFCSLFKDVFPEAFTDKLLKYSFL